MAHRTEHNKDCRRLLGKAWQEVHVFLDQYVDIFNVSCFGMYHRTFLHNRYGLEMVRAMRGEQAYLAAAIHLVRDSWAIPIDHKDLNFVKAELGKTLMYFNNMDHFDPGIKQFTIEAWKGESLVSIARMGDK